MTWNGDSKLQLMESIPQMRDFSHGMDITIDRIVITWCNLLDLLQNGDELQQATCVQIAISGAVEEYN